MKKRSAHVSCWTIRGLAKAALFAAFVLISMNGFAGPTLNGTDAVVPTVACDDPETPWPDVSLTLTCYQLIVKTDPALSIDRFGDEVPDIEIRERLPVGAAVGAVLFFSGEKGTQYYDIVPTTHLHAGGTVAVMRANGYKTYEARWLNEDGTNFGDGWLSGLEGRGPKVATAGSREVIEWIKGNMAVDVPLCATGNSYGGVQIAYAIAAHDAGQYLKSAVYSAGPSVVDIPRGCFRQTYDNGLLTNPQNITLGFHIGTLRSDIIDALMGWTDVDNNCGTDEDHPTLASTYNTADAQAMALVSYGDLEEARDYGPATRQFFVEAELDFTGATVQGLLYYMRVTGHKGLTVISQTHQDTPTSSDFAVHTVYNTETGARLIRAYLLYPGNCSD